MNKIKYFFLLLPFIGLCCWSFYYTNFIKHAVTVVLPVTGYDPRNLLSGHYLEFQVDWKKANCYQADWNGICPKHAFLKANRYYIPEKYASRLEDAINSGKNTKIVFSYKKDYRPIPKELLINEQSWKTYIQKPDYADKHCYSQGGCGGTNSGYFCNSNGHHTPNKCEKTNPEKVIVKGQTYYYNKLSDLQSWCREAFESKDDRNSQGNCNWGYLSYQGAVSWCDSIGKNLVSAEEIEQNCDQFLFLPQANSDQQYWTRNLNVVHMGQSCSVQKMSRGDGYAWAGAVICQ